MGSNRDLIMLVDDDMISLGEIKQALGDAYDIFTASSAKKMFELLETERPELIILATDMPEMNGFEAIRVLKNNPKTKDILVIFSLNKIDAVEQAEGLKLGAIDFIIKPFLPQLLIRRIEAHLMLSRQEHTIELQKREFRNFNDTLQSMVDEKTRTIKDLQKAILKVMAEMVESRDDVTGGHIERTQHGISVLVTELLNQQIYPEQTEGWDVEVLLDASQLHDVGKIYINDQILRKPGKLTPDEFEEMKKHTDYGNTIIDRIEAITHPNELTKHAKIFAGFHHEKWNGTGYPLGLSGQDIPLQGRVMAVADVYDALISERPYKKSMPHEEAVRIILEDRGSHFDPVLVDLFSANAERFKSISEIESLRTYMWG
ncbi:response regulator [Spirochaetia bacterium]|nr:response regulator [Spirochaetia bacterium]